MKRANNRTLLLMDVKEYKKEGFEGPRVQGFE